MHSCAKVLPFFISFCPLHFTMRGQSEVVAAIFILAIVIASSILYYFFFQSIQSNVQSSSGQSTKQVSKLPPNIETVYTQPPSPIKKTTTLCSIIRNRSPEPMKLTNVTIYLYKDGVLMLSETNTYNNCGGIVQPNSVCKVCADVIIPEEGAYIYEFACCSTPISSTTVEVPESHVSLYPDLVISSIKAYQHHYDSSTLLFGDYNSFELNITVCNKGREDMNTAATLELSATNATLANTHLPVPQLSVDQCITISTDGNTTSASDVTVTASVSYSQTELFTQNNRKSVTFVNAYYLECDSNSTCESDLSSALNFVNSAADANAYVVLTADITGYLNFPSGDYKWRVVFDGNGHDATNGGYEWAVALNIHDVNHVIISDLNVFCDSYAILLSNSSAIIQDVNASANSYAIELNFSSATLRNVIASAGHEAIHLSSSFATLQDVNATASSEDAISLESNSSAIIQDVNASANSDAIHISSSSAVLQDVVATATSFDAIALSASSVTLQNVTAFADESAIYLEDNSSATLRSVNIFSNGTGTTTVESDCSGCANKLDIDLSIGDTSICGSSDGNIWYLYGGELNVNCLSCGTEYYLRTDFSSKGGSGTLNVNGCNACTKPC